jgi:hypothetical protein
LAAVTVAVVVLAGLAAGRNLGGSRSDSVQACGNCGVVEHVLTLQPERPAWNGREAGRSTSFALLGALGGAHLGGEPPANEARFRITVRMGDGSTRTVFTVLDPGIGIGARVRVVNGALVALG